MKLTAVLPTYNERDNIGPLIDAVLGAGVPETEVVVVDDDSPDGTWQVVEARAAADPEHVRLIRRVGRRGLTSAIQEGIDAARGEYVAWMDCDFSHPPELLARLVRDLDEGADIAVASRYLPGGGDERNHPLHEFLSRTIDIFAAWVLDPAFRDYTSGYLCARRAALQGLRLRGDYGEYFIDLIYRALRRGLRVVELPYVNTPRRTGTSKTATNLLGFVRRGSKYVTTIVRLRLRGADA